MIGDTCQTVPGKLRSSRPASPSRPCRPDAAADPAATAARAAPSRRPRRCRNSAPAPAPTTWPASTLRDRTRPAVGARMSSRPICARGSRRAAPGRRGRARQRRRGWRASGRYRPWTDEAAADQRLGAVEFVLGQRGVGARDLDLRGELRCLLRLDRTVDDSPAPGRRGPTAGLDSTRATWPPSPATPTGMSRRAASEPVAVIVRATSLRPGTMTVTVGICPALAAGRAAGGRRVALAAEHEISAGHHEHDDDRGNDHVRRRRRASTTISRSADQSSFRGSSVAFLSGPAQE